MKDEDWMRLAIDWCRRGIARGQSPFGALIVRAGAFVAGAHNTVWRDLDSTAHAEVNAIRKAEARTRSISLSGATLYTTCEPCPMCLAAIHWAKLDRVVFGARIDDAARAGFGELAIPARRMVELGGSRLDVVEDVLRDECAALFREWQDSGMAKPY